MQKEIFVKKWIIENVDIHGSIMIYGATMLTLNTPNTKTQKHKNTKTTQNFELWATCC